MDLVSIIMPCYNSEDTIVATIDSIKSQTYTNWELIIVDDYSTDGTVELVNSFLLDERIVLKKSTTNVGAGRARNIGLDISKGRFVAFCDSDDCWNPEKLSKQLAFMKANNHAITFTSYIKKYLNNEVLILAKSRVDYRKLLQNNWLGCLTVMYDKNVFNAYRFPEFRKRQDWLMWLTLLERGQIAHSLAEPLAIYNVRRGSLSNSSKFSLVRTTWFIYRKALSFSNLKAMFYTFQYLLIQIRLKIK